MNIKKGQTIFWRWKKRGGSYRKNVITDVQDGLIMIGSNLGWIDLEEIDVAIPYTCQTHKTEQGG